MASHPIYQIYSKLEDTELKIWRRFEVMDNITVARLGYILMTMYEMEASHLFSFEKVNQSGVAYVRPFTMVLRRRFFGVRNGFKLDVAKDG